MALGKCCEDSREDSLDIYWRLASEFGLSESVPSEADRLREQVRILREALEDARTEIAMRVREDGGDDLSVKKACAKQDAALESTKEHE